MQISSVGGELWHPQSTLSICYCWHHLLCGTDIGYCFWLNLLLSSWLVVVLRDIEGTNKSYKLDKLCRLLLGRMQSAVRCRRWCREMHCSYSIFVGSVVQVHCCTGEWKTLGWGHDNLVHDGQIQSHCSWGGDYGRWQAFHQRPPSKASVNSLIMSVLFCFPLTHCPFLCRASLHHHQAV